MKSLLPTSILLFTQLDPHRRTAFGNPIINTVKTGTCENLLTGKPRCAMQLQDCEPEYIDGLKNPKGERWYNAYRMEMRGDKDDDGYSDGSGPALDCSCENTVVGSCIKTSSSSSSSSSSSNANNNNGGGFSSTLDFRCAPHASACHLREGEIFSLVDFSSTMGTTATSATTGGNTCGCSAYGDTTTTTATTTTTVNNNAKTLYGACRRVDHQRQDGDNDYFCAYSPSDCEGDNGYDWVEPNSVAEIFGSACYCENTHIGGCIGGFMSVHSASSFFCAVTPDDCSFDRYVPPYSLKKDHGYNCRLCGGGGGETLNTNVKNNTAGAIFGSALPVGAIIGIFLGVVCMSGITVYSYRTRGSTSRRLDERDDNEVGHGKEIGNDTEHEEGVIA